MSASDHSILHSVCLIVALFAGVPAQAQPSPLITDEDIARARRETPSVTGDDIRRAQQKHAAPVTVPPMPPSPRIEALPQPITERLPDLAGIAQGYANGTGQSDTAAALGAGPGLFVFVSLAMPEATLACLVDQAARARATVLIRGLANGSLRETVARIQKLIGNRQIAVQIDPQAFDRYAITRVPSFVLARDGTRPTACANGSCPPAADYVQTAGDVSLDYALDHMRRTAPRFQSEAGAFLARLKP